MSETTSQLNGAPQLNVVTSSSDRKQLGNVDGNYVDVYNSAQMAKYNNEYALYLKQLEQEYNSPAAQVARLKEAGLNPNYNSIDGTGNVNYNPSSQSVATNAAQNKQAQISNVLNGVNTLLKAAVDGANIVGQVSGIPSDIGSYRKVLNQIASAGLANKEADNALKEITTTLNQLKADNEAEKFRGLSYANDWYAYTHGSSEFYDGQLDAFLHSPAGQELKKGIDNLDLLGQLRQVAVNYDKVIKDENYAKDLVEHIKKMWDIDEKFGEARNDITGWQADTVKAQTVASFLMKFLMLLK